MLALGLGASVFGAAGRLTVYRPYFMTLSLASLSWTFWRFYRHKLAAARGLGLQSALAALIPGRRDAPLFLLAGLVIALILFPYWGVPLFAG